MERLRVSSPHIERDTIMTIKHAKLSASGSHRWLYCAGSVQAEKGIKNRSSPFAEYGTCAHELAEMMLNDPQLSPSDYIGKILIDAPDVKVDAEMVENCARYAEYCRDLMAENSVMIVEQRVDFSEWVPDGFGTADCIIIDGSVCHVIDLKMGKGMAVHPENNPQAMLYALGVLSDYGYIYDIERFVIHIYQPRINNISEWEISTIDLLEWAEWVKGRAAACLEPDAERTAGESQCTWCKAKATCPTLQKHVEDTISAEFDDLELPDPKRSNISNILRNKRLIESFLKAVEDYAHQQLSDGQEVEGFKLVEGTSRRRWGDESIAVKVITDKIGDKAYTEPKLISVAQAEKAIGKKDFAALADELVVKPQGSPTLAPVDDRRPAIKNIVDMFD